MRRAVFTSLTVILLTLVGAYAANRPPIDQWDTSELIAALADPDSAIRNKAADRLVDIGLPARPDIIQAARGDNPEQRAQAARILRKLPWASNDDPADVRELLDRYGESSDMARSSIVFKLHELRAAPTLLRLLHEEPSDVVRWMIVFALYDNRDTATQKTLRALQPADGDTPVLLIAGRTWLERDRTKALAYFRRAIDADSARPSNDMGLLGLAYEQLVAFAMETHDFEEAATLLRRQVPRELVPRRSLRRMRRTSDASLPRLLVLHEYFGPLRRFAWDCQTWSINSSEKPRLLDGISTRLAWLGFAPPLPMGLTAKLSMTDRYKAGMFLAASELTRAADIELEAAAKLLDGTPDQRRRIIRGSESGREDVDDMLSELHWRRARAAQIAGDIPAADREVQRLIDFNPSNTDSAIKIINWLKETKRTNEAKTLFTRIYDTGRERIEASVNKAAGRNDVAWLCARCGEKLEEAIELAQAAVDEMPDVAAFLDTLAEAKYRSGAVDEAIKLEFRALELAPETKFMKEQLERFKSGKP